MTSIVPTAKSRLDALHKVDKIEWLQPAETRCYTAIQSCRSHLFNTSTPSRVAGNIAMGDHEEVSNKRDLAYVESLQYNDHLFLVSNF